MSRLTPDATFYIHAVVAALDASSCPRNDGLTLQFFLEYFDSVHGPLLRGLQQIFYSGSMPTSMCSTLIALIPKGGDPTLLRQWRPITLLPSVYKILARLISARLQPPMPSHIHGSQTTFIQDRCILNNVFTFYTAAEYAKPSAHFISVLVDFETAYDRVDWDFLEGTLANTLGFPRSWISGVSALHRFATSALTIGRFLRRHFTLGHSQHQGYPLAPYLFLFSVDALSGFLCTQSPVVHAL